MCYQREKNKESKGKCSFGLKLELPTITNRNKKEQNSRGNKSTWTSNPKAQVVISLLLALHIPKRFTHYTLHQPDFH
jgi:hypothetical protein